MRITAKELRTIIKEEVSQVLMREETLEEGKIGKLEALLHTIVLGTTLGGLLDAVYHQEPTAPVAHVLDAMYEVAKDMPPGEKVTAGSFTKHVIKKIGGAIVPDEEVPSKDKMDEGIADKANQYLEVIKRELVDNGVAASVAGTLALSIATMLQAGGADVNPAKAVALLGAVGTAVQAGMKVANISNKSGGDAFSQVKPD